MTKYEKNLAKIANNLSKNCSSFILIAVKTDPKKDDDHKFFFNHKGSTEYWFFMLKAYLTILAKEWNMSIDDILDDLKAHEIGGNYKEYYPNDKIDPSDRAKIIDYLSVLDQVAGSDE